MKKIKEFKNLFKANSYFFRYMFKHGKLLFVFQLIIIGLSVPLNFIQLYAPKNFIDSIFTATTIWYSIRWIVLLICAQILYYIVSSSFNIYRQYIFSNAKLSTKEHTYQHFIKLYMSYYDNNEQLNRIQRALVYGENGGTAFLMFIFSLLTMCSSLLVVTYVSFNFDWWIWILIVSIFAIKLIIGNITKRLNFEHQQEKTIRSRKIGYYASVITNKDTLPEIKIYNSSDFFLKKHRDVYIEDRNKQIKFDIKIILLSLAEQLPDKAFDILSYLIIGIRLYNNSATLGDYTMFFSMIAQINALLNNFRGNFNALYEHALAAKNYNEFMDDSSHLISIPLNATKINRISSIELKEVSFKYANQQSLALNKIDFRISSGERVAIVGLNGAGKTTLIKLLLMLYRPLSGQILINDIDVSKIDYPSYYERIGMVFQNHHEYAITIAENICFTEDIKSEEQSILYALKRVDLYDKVMNLSEKIDTPLTHNFYKNGVDFSGGERQRLSIARAVARDCDLYIFDEPSSALDAKAENDLFDFINTISKDKGIIFISHRLSSAILADRVIVMKDGVIIANAPHNVLIRTCHEYKQMYDLQSKRYK